MKFQIASLSIFLSALVTQATADMEIIQFDKWGSLTACAGIGEDVCKGTYTDGVVSVSSISLFIPETPFFTITNFCQEPQVDFYQGNGSFWDAYRHDALPPVHLAKCVAEDPGHRTCSYRGSLLGKEQYVGYYPKVACIGTLCGDGSSAPG
jgi:hypothetical protein